MTPEQVAALLTLVDLLGKGSVVVVLLLGIWAFYTRRIVPIDALREANARTEKAENQRDAAILLSQAQVELTKELNRATAEAVQTSRDTLEYLREELPRRRVR